MADAQRAVRVSLVLLSVFCAQHVGSAQRMCFLYLYLACILRRPNPQEFHSPSSRHFYPDYNLVFLPMRHLVLQGGVRCLEHAHVLVDGEAMFCGTAVEVDAEPVRWDDATVVDAPLESSV